MNKINLAHVSSKYGSNPGAGGRWDRGTVISMTTRMSVTGRVQC